MRSSVSLALLLAACSGSSDPPRALATTVSPARAPSSPDRSPSPAAPLPPEAGAPDGPAGTSGAGAARYDEVGYATWYGEELSGSRTASGAPFVPSAITAAHRTLPLNSYAEVTSLDTGRTILVLINDRGPGRRDRLIDLSRGAADLLGTHANPMAAVRIRSAMPAPGDAPALASGRPASARLDAPPALLAVLRRRLPRAYVAPKTPVTRAPVPASPAPIDRVAQPAAKGRYLVQVAAFSNEARAKALADRLDGRVEGGGGIYRVRLGPFRDAASAQRARDDAAKRGYGDATIIAQPQNQR